MFKIVSLLSEGEVILRFRKEKKNLCFCCSATKT